MTKVNKIFIFRTLSIDTVNTDALMYRARPTELINEKLEKGNLCRRAELIEGKSSARGTSSFLII